MKAPVRPAGQGRLAIIAGYGRLPHDVAVAAREIGENPLIAVLKNEQDREWTDFEHFEIGTGDVATLNRVFRENGVDRVVLSGGVRRRPEWREIRPTLRHLLRVPSVMRILLSKGDDTVLRMVIDILETSGYRVIGAQEVVPGLVAEPGVLTRSRPKEEDWVDIRAGCIAAVELGRLDIGQAVVSVGGRVVALEGLEGTDQMLERVAQLREEGRLSQRRRGVLVKVCKPQQEERADLPSIGLWTVENAAKAGLAGIAVEVGRALVLDRAEMIARADSLGIFIIGIDREKGGIGR